MLPVRVVGGRRRRQAEAGRGLVVVMMMVVVVMVVMMMVVIVVVVVMMLRRSLDVDVRVLPTLVVVAPDRRARDGHPGDERRRDEGGQAEESTHPG